MSLANVGSIQVAELVFWERWTLFAAGYTYVCYRAFSYKLQIAEIPSGHDSLFTRASGTACAVCTRACITYNIHTHLQGIL